MITSPGALLRAALLVFAGILLPNLAALALTDQTPPTAFIVQEDFVPLRNQWQPASGSWSISAGTYNSTAAGSADIATIVEYRGIDPAAPPSPEISFDQFSFRANLRNKGTGAQHLVGVVYRYQNSANYYEAVLSATGTASLRRVRNGVAASLVSFPVGIPRNTWFDLEVKWNKGVTTLSVNGQPIVSGITQNEFQSGQIGLVAHGVVGQYDKVQVTTPFGDQPFRHDFSSDPPGWTLLSGQWAVLNGTYNNAAVQQTNITFAPIHTGVSPDQTIEYTLRVRMLNPYGGPGNLVGIVFNHSGSRYTEVVFSPTGVAKMNLVSNGRVQTLATAAYTGRRNIWFDVTLDSTASVWVDGERIFNRVPRANPDLAPMGRVGLITHWAPGKFDDVWFDHGTFSPCSDPFSSNIVPEVVSGTWNVSGGRLNGTSVNARSIALPCRGSGNLSGADAGTDFVYSARLLNEYGASGNLVGLIFNYQGPADHYELVFSPTGSGILNKVIQGARYSVAEFPHNVPSNTWFDVQLFRSGINSTIKVNGATVVSDVPQGELRGGRIGVVTHWAKASFDDLSLLPHVVRSAPVTYTLTYIATWPPAATRALSGVFDLNDEGELAGTQARPAGQQAFTWREGTFRNLNPLLPTGNRGGLAFALNNQSDVAGKYQNPQFQDRPFLLSRAGQLIPLTNIPDASVDVLDVNDRREVLFRGFTPNGTGSIWRSGQLTPLEIGAVAINNLGVVAGDVPMPTFLSVPALWQDRTVMPLTLPEGSQGASSVELNDHDAVVATAFFFDSGSTRQQGYIWHEGEVMPLLPPDPALSSSQPRDINNRGVVVGFCFNNIQGSETPTVWDGPRGQDLNMLISRQDPHRPFVHLKVAAHINNRGQIVAHGVDSRQPADSVSWYLLTPVAAQ